MFSFPALFRRKVQEQKLDSELRFHLECQIQEKIAAGMDPTEARRQTTLEFGGLEQWKEACRDERRGQWLETTLQDLRFGIRTLRRAPGFTAAALATIAIGIGANTAIFSFVNAVLLAPLPYPDADRIVAIVEKPPKGNWSPISTLNYLDWEKHNTVFEHMTVQHMDEVALTGIEFPVHLLDLQVSAHFFDIFRIRPALGRTFLDGEDQAGASAVAILTHKAWVARFAADPAIIGKTIFLDAQPTTVVGVMPPGVLDRNWAEIYRPLTFTPQQKSRDGRWLLPAYARLKSGVTLDQARAEMDLLGADIARRFPETNKGWGVNTMRFDITLVSDDLRQSLYVLMAAVGLVLLIACANLGNLALARGLARSREVGIRVALGAGRARLIRQFLTESLLLSTIGGLLGLLVGFGGIAVLKLAPPGGFLPPTATVEVDGRVLAFTLSLSLLTGVIFGLMPALKAARLDLTPAIKEGGSASGSGRTFRQFRSGLVVSEVALAFILLAGAGLLIRSFFKLQQVDAGFDSTHLATAYLPLAEKRYSTATELNLYLHQVVDRISALPGVNEVALTTAPPINWGWGFKTPFQIEGQKSVLVAERPQCGFKVVTPSYFHTLRMKLLQGRLLDPHDVSGSVPVAVISESFAKKHFPKGSALGKHVSVQELALDPKAVARDILWEIVGVVHDEKNSGLRDEDFPGMYVTEEQSPTKWQFLIVRTDIDPVVLERSMRVALRELSGDQVMDNVITFEQVKANSMAGDRRRAWLLGVFAGIALLLAAMGLYGVIAYSVTQRTREIGIRTALGATPGNILTLIVRSGLRLTAAGLLIGVVGALGLSQILASLLFDVGKYDPATLATVGILLGGTALLASYLPARRATRMNPVAALNCE